MQQNDTRQNKAVTRPRLARTRIVGIGPENVATGPLLASGELSADQVKETTSTQAATVKALPELQIRKAVRLRPPASFQMSAWSGPREEISDQSTAHIMQLSGMMRPLRKVAATTPLPAVVQDASEEDGYWPLGIQQTGPLPIVNLYGREPFGRTLPPAVPLVGLPVASSGRVQVLGRKVLGAPAFKISLGLAIGVALLLLVSRFIDLPQTLHILQVHLTTVQGIGLALLAGVTYLTAHSIRGMRWKLFLNPVGKVSLLKAIELYQVAIFLNFLLPIRAGEAAKSLVLKRIAHIPISKSLPTVAMDKSLDLVPALVIMALVPLFGVHMDIQLWLVLGVAGSGLIGLLIFIALAAWKRTFAIGLLQRMAGFLPRALGNRVESFATGFIDALLAGASRPSIFLPALLLTCVAVFCDGLFALFAFWAIGFPVSLGTVLFGYTVYNVFYILPTPPGQVGSNEAVGLLVFSGLLHLPGNYVTAMYVFSHPWAALIMTTVGLSCLAALGLTFSNAMRMPPSPEQV